MRFRVLEGKHTEPGEKIEGQENRAPGATYKKGDVFESDRELDKLFQNKFERLPDEPSATVKAKQKAKAKAKEEDEEEDDEEELESEANKGASDKATTDRKGDKVGVTSLESKLGENVTEDFPDALEADLAVFKKGRSYYVADADDPDSNLADDALDKSGVKKFLKKQLK